MTKSHEAKVINRLSAHHYRRFDSVVFDSAKDVWLWDTNGKKYLDMLSTYSAVGVGNNHPRIKQVLQEDLPMLGHCHMAKVEAEFLENLTAYTDFEKALLMNTGAEAVETAIKLARKWAYTHKNVPLNEAEIIVARNNFHGRTTTIISASTEEEYKKYFGPHTPGFKAVSLGDIDELIANINSNTAAVLLEPIQGEGGVIIPPDYYLQDVQILCKTNNILLMLDEIQTGFGRTGKNFAFEHCGIKPDVLIVGKALGGGVYPVSGVLASRKLMDVFEPGDHGSTFGGNAVACAVANEAINIIKEEKLVENSHYMGQYLQDRLYGLQSPLIGEIRGKGLLVGVELAPKAGNADDLCEELLARGIIAKGAHKTVLRLAPPLTIQKQHIDYFINIFSEVIS